VRMFDIRVGYADSWTGAIPRNRAECHQESVMPQAFGGGREGRLHQPEVTEGGSLLLNYPASTRRRPTLFSIDWRPFDGNQFIVAGSEGNVRLFDMRRITNFSPDCYLNIYRNVELGFDQGFEATGCAFSADGSEIVVTCLNDHIYLFDTDHKYEAVDYFIRKTHRHPSKPADSQPEEAELVASDHEERGEQETGSFALTTETIIELMMLPQQARERRLQELYEAHMRSSANAQEEQEQKENIEVPITFKAKFRGHISVRTIKACNFFGPDSEYVISGSDDGRVFFWDKKTQRVLNVLEGHASVVNVLEPHPWLPVLATSGIDNEVKIWSPEGAYPTREEQLNLRRRWNRIIKQNRDEMQQSQ